MLVRDDVTNAEVEVTGLSGSEKVTLRIAGVDIELSPGGAREVAHILNVTANFITFVQRKDDPDYALDPDSAEAEFDPDRL